MTLGLPLVAYAAACLGPWTEPEWRPEWDSALYLLTARSLVRGEGYVYLGEAFFLRPPGLPALVAASVPDLDPLWLNRLVMSLAAASVAAAGFAFLPRGRALALGAALLAGTSPLFVERFNWVLSEFPFAVLLYLGLGLLERSGAGARRAGSKAVLGTLCLAAACYVRTVGLLAVPALALAALRARSRARTRLALACAGVMLCALPWLVHARLAASSSSLLGEQLLLADYLTATLRSDPGDPSSPWIGPGELARRAAGNGGWLLRTLARATFGTETAALGLVVAALALGGWRRALRRGPGIGELFGCCYLALLLVYLAQERRLLAPLVPLLYLGILSGLADLAAYCARATGSRKLAPAIPGAVAVLLALSNVTLLPGSLDWANRRLRDGGLLGERWADARRVAHWVREATGPNAILLCREAPIQELLTGRRVYTYRFRPGPELLARREPHYVILEDPPLTPPGFAALVAERALRTHRIPSERFAGGIPVYELRREPLGPPLLPRSP